MSYYLKNETIMLNSYKQLILIRPNPNVLITKTTKTSPVVKILVYIIPVALYLFVAIFFKIRPISFDDWVIHIGIFSLAIIFSFLLNKFMDLSDASFDYKFDSASGEIWQNNKKKIAFDEINQIEVVKDFDDSYNLRINLKSGKSKLLMQFATNGEALQLASAISDLVGKEVIERKSISGT